MSNFPDIFRGFMARGIPEEDIRPRENVFTYHAWRALGRQVRKGEKGVRILTWITPHEDGPAVNPETGKPKSGRSFPKATYVFHVSQTDAITEG
jgi:antirestriction protein ArdC